MANPAAKAELMHSLRRVVRGLSALFWGLPLTLLVCVRSSDSTWPRPVGIIPPVVTTGLLFYGLAQLSYFQRQERVWIHALDRAKVLALVNIGLSPFVFWWGQLPHVPFYFLTVGLLLLSGVLFLFNLNFVLQRLAAMLPDETLRLEAKFFTSFNIYLLFAVVAVVALYVWLKQLDQMPHVVSSMMKSVPNSQEWLIVILAFLPLALTMTLIWKMKEVVLASVFDANV